MSISGYALFLGWQDGSAGGSWLWMILWCFCHSKSLLIEDWRGENMEAPGRIRGGGPWVWFIISPVICMQTIPASQFPKSFIFWKRIPDSLPGLSPASGREIPVFLSLAFFLSLSDALIHLLLTKGKRGWEDRRVWRRGLIRSAPFIRHLIRLLFSQLALFL